MVIVDPMKSRMSKQLSKDDWLRAALQFLNTSGIESVKIVPLAAQLGVTSGSFYWHFANRPELYRALLDYWETEMTDKAIDAARRYSGSPEDRIWNLMEKVMDSGMAKYDLAVWHWAQSDGKAREVFSRAIEKRFAFAAWMFEQVGFDASQAEVRGRMMVVYMMGESTLLPGEPSDRKEGLRLKHQILITAA
jgi:AcrR family transcriptional regulator